MTGVQTCALPIYNTTTTTKKNKKNPKNKGFKPGDLKKLFNEKCIIEKPLFFGKCLGIVLFLYIIELLLILFLLKNIKYISFFMRHFFIVCGWYFLIVIFFSFLGYFFI